MSHSPSDRGRSTLTSHDDTPKSRETEACAGTRLPDTHWSSLSQLGARIQGSSCSFYCTSIAMEPSCEIGDGYWQRPCTRSCQGPSHSRTLPAAKEIISADVAGRRRRAGTRSTAAARVPGRPLAPNPLATRSTGAAHPLADSLGRPRASPPYAARRRLTAPVRGTGKRQLRLRVRRPGAATPTGPEGRVAERPWNGGVGRCAGAGLLIADRFMYTWKS